MHVAVVLALLAVSVVGDQYSPKFDNINLDGILSNDRLVKNYINCFVEKGPCTPDGEAVRKVLPEVLQTDCGKCSDKQRGILNKIFKYIFNKDESEYLDVAAKYDPDGMYRKRYRTKLGV